MLADLQCPTQPHRIKLVRLYLTPISTSIHLYTVDFIPRISTLCYLATRVMSNSLRSSPMFGTATIAVVVYHSTLPLNILEKEASDKDTVNTLSATCSSNQRRSSNAKALNLSNLEGYVRQTR